MKTDGCQAFFERRLAPLALDANLLGRAGLAHAALLRAIYCAPAMDGPHRRPSMCLDGTPIVYSTKRSKDTPFPSFRMLVEPGDLRSSVPEQISHSLRTVDRLLGTLGWQSTATDLNAILERALPSDPKELEGAWGGIWLGMEVGRSGLELRMYLNLRRGLALARWQRVADVLAWFASDTFTPCFRAFVSRVGPHAIPVGLAVAFGEEVRALRVYAGMHEPSCEAIEASASGLNGRSEPLQRVCRLFVQRLGEFRRQSVTLGFDYHLDRSRVLDPAPLRTKVDICCQQLPDNTAAALAPVLETLGHVWCEAADVAEGFLDDVTTCFGGASIEYVGFGSAKSIDHMSVYAKPSGFQRR